MFQWPLLFLYILPHNYYNTFWLFEHGLNYHRIDNSPKAVQVSHSAWNVRYESFSFTGVLASLGNFSSPCVGFLSTFKSGGLRSTCSLSVIGKCPGAYKYNCYSIYRVTYFTLYPIRSDVIFVLPTKFFLMIFSDYTNLSSLVSRELLFVYAVYCLLLYHLHFFVKNSLFP